MAALTPSQRRTRARFERLIGLMAPGLNLVLAVGERISKVVEPEDSEYYPIRSGLIEGREAHPTRSGGGTPARDRARGDSE